MPREVVATTRKSRTLTCRTEVATVPLNSVTKVPKANPEYCLLPLECPDADNCDSSTCRVDVGQAR